MNTIAIIIQARTGSSRLPGKMILPFYHGKCILELLVERIREKMKHTPIIVATTVEQGDDAIVDVCKNIKVDYYRGSETDVLQRFIGAAEAGGYDKIIRICADNLFLDVNALEKLIGEYEKEDADYFSYRTSAGKPAILTHFGLWAIEGTTTKTLRRVSEITSEKLYHEHVTNYIYNHPDDFKIKFLPIMSEIQKKEDLRLTIDTAEDFRIMQDIYTALDETGQMVTPEHIVEYLDAHDDVYKVMNKIIKENKK